MDKAQQKALFFALVEAIGPIPGHLAFDIACRVFGVKDADVVSFVKERSEARASRGKGHDKK